MMMRLKFLSIPLLVLFSLSAFASSDKPGKHALSVGGGVSSPSGVTSLLGENPAGLIYNQRVSLFGEGFTEGSGVNNPGFGGHALLGSGSVGAGVGLRSYDVGSSRSNLLNFGLGAYANPIKTALGVGGTYGFDGGGTNLNVGMIFDPMGAFRVGAILYGVTGGVDQFGAGLAYDINNDATLALDASSQTDFGGLSLKPGIGVSVEQFQFTVGYGFNVESNRSSRMDTGFTAGAGFYFGRGFHCQYYYQQLDKHELGLKYTF